MQEFYETITIENRGKRQPFLEAIDLFHSSISFGPPGISSRSGLWGGSLSTCPVWQSSWECSDLFSCQCPGRHSSLGGRASSQLAGLSLQSPLSNRGPGIPALASQSNQELHAAPGHKSLLAHPGLSLPGQGTPSSRRQKPLIHQPSVHTRFCLQRPTAVLSDSDILAAAYNDYCPHLWTGSSF